MEGSIVYHSKIGQYTASPQSDLRITRWLTYTDLAFNPSMDKQSHAQ